MSKKFWAKNRETGQRWQKDQNIDHNYLVMYDSGYLAEVRVNDYVGHIETSIKPLDLKIWEKVVK